MLPPSAHTKPLKKSKIAETIAGFGGGAIVAAALQKILKKGMLIELTIQTPVFDSVTIYEVVDG